MRYDISGTTMQTVSIDLAPGEALYSQTATMAWMSDNIRMDTHTGGGLFAGLKRAFAGGLMQTLSSPLPFRGGAGGGASPDSWSYGARPHPNPAPKGEGLT